MINREQKTVLVRRFLSGVDEYGQKRKVYIEDSSESVFMKFYSGVLNQNPGYEDIDYIVLTKRRDIDSTYFLTYNNKNYRVIHVVPSRKFNELFIRETGEDFQQAKLPSPYDLVYEEDELYYKFTWTSDVEVKYFTLELYKSDDTLVGNYEHLSFPRFFIPKSVMTLTPGGYKFRVKSLNPDIGYADSDWSEWCSFTVLQPLDTPTPLRFLDLPLAMEFSFTEVENATKYKVEVVDYRGVPVKEYFTVNSPCRITATASRLPSGSYKFRVVAQAPSSEIYTDSEPSDWKSFTVM